MNGSARKRKDKAASGQPMLAAYREQEFDGKATRKVKLTASLPLQVLIYYNAIVSLCYFSFLTATVWTKINAGYTSIPATEYFTLPFAYGIFTLFEGARLYFGYMGNAEENVPQLSAFVIGTCFPQLPLLCYLGFGQLSIVFPWERPMAVVLILILIAELFFSYGALRKLIDRQTASFFRLVQQEDDFDREMKSYEKTTKKD